MIRKRFQGMADNIGDKEEGSRVSELPNMAGSNNGADSGFEETQGRDEKSYVRTRRRPHRKLRLFEDDEDDDVGVIGEGFCFQEGRSEIHEGKGNHVSSTKGAVVGREIETVPVAGVEHRDGSVGMDVDGRCTEFGISGEKNEVDVVSWDPEFLASSKADADDGCSGFGVSSNNIEGDVAPELGILSSSNDVGSTECEMLSAKVSEPEVDYKNENANAERRSSGNESKCDTNDLLLVKKNEADPDDTLLLEKNGDMGKRMPLQKDEKVDEKLSRRRNTGTVMEGHKGIAELWPSKEKTEAAVEERCDRILDLQRPEMRNEVDVDGINDESVELEILGEKKAAADGGTNGCRILRKRKRMIRDDATGREHGNAKLLLERKRRRRVGDNDLNKGKEDDALQMNLLQDGKIDRKTSIIELKKSLNRKLEGSSIIEASEVDDLAHKSSSHFEEAASRKKSEKKLRRGASIIEASVIDEHAKKTSGSFEGAVSEKKSEKKLRESRMERLSMGSKRFDRGVSNGSGMDSLIRGILLKPNSGGTSRDGRIQRNKSEIGVVSTVMDGHDTKSTHYLKQTRVGVVTSQLGSKSMDRDSLRREKSDLKGKKIVASVSPPRDSLSVLHLQKQKKMLKSPPTLQRESKIAKERKTTVPHLAEEKPKSSLVKEMKTPVSSFSKETKAMQRVARSEDRKRLRERLRDALLDAGWKIDLRPRKGKNYDDNVYISPVGTSFWSLPKAWNALKGSLGMTEEISGSLEESKEAETSKHVDTGNGGEGGASNMLLIKVIDEDLSLLQRKRRRIIEDAERKNGKGKKKRKSSHEVDIDERANKIKKDGKRVKIRKSLSKTDSEDTDLTDVKLKEIRKKFKVSGLDASNLNSKFSDKNNINDRMMTPLSGQKHIKRRLHGDSERKHSASKALSNHDVVKSGSSQVKKNKSRRGGCGLLVRSSKKGDKRGQGVSNIIKRTVISWLVDVGIVPENESVQYWNKKGTIIMLEGWVRRDGILCECCNKVISVSKFEDHAGATRHRPFENIYLSSGKSLTQCLREAWDTQEESRKCGKSIIQVDEDDQNDDTCGLCGDGGDLICCDKCPSTFHQDCLELKSIPEGDWYCLNCTCGVCGKVGHVGENATSTMADVLFCEQCEHEYHKKCLQERGIQMSCPVLENSSFCGKACQKVYDGLEHLLGTSNSLGDGFFWTLLRRFDDDQQNSSSQGPSQDRIAECNAKLSVAHIVMDECFMPIVDKRTNIDMVSNVVFSCWSNFSRLNYQGFYTAVLEKDDEIISVASIRIHGARLAEMPLIGTRHHYRRQGMCRRLVNAIENMLLSLQVEKLILPAVPDLLQTWTVAFGFNPLEVSHKTEIRHLNLMVFPGTDLLQKQICNQEAPTNQSAG